jgi:hypothetical protein
MYHPKPLSAIAYLNKLQVNKTFYFGTEVVMVMQPQLFLRGLACNNRVNRYKSSRHQIAFFKGTEGFPPTPFPLGSKALFTLVKLPICKPLGNKNLKRLDLCELCFKYVSNQLKGRFQVSSKVETSSTFYLTLTDLNNSLKNVSCCLTLQIIETNQNSCFFAGNIEKQTERI